MLRIYVKSPPAPVEIVSDYYPVEYGLLYNWYAATDTRGITAIGWHIPSLIEMKELADSIGASGDYVSNTVGIKLKYPTLTYWDSPNTGSTNEVGFNAKGSGSRHAYGVFESLKRNTYFWTSTETDATKGKAGYLAYNVQAFYLGFLPEKDFGLSIRPIKDSTTLTHGQTGTYIGNDGKIYRTICIGTQEWLADNLCETKYRNGEYIPGFDGGVYTPIDNATWAAATTAMCCVYDDDLTNM
jgi:uncharacterized protein (TIGR02145 family)